MERGSAGEGVAILICEHWRRKRKKVDEVLSKVMFANSKVEVGKCKLIDVMLCLQSRRLKLENASL